MDQRVAEALSYCAKAQLGSVVLAIPFVIDAEEQKELRQLPQCRALILRNPSPDLTSISTSDWLGCFDEEGGWRMPSAKGPLVFVGAPTLLNRLIVARIWGSGRTAVHCRFGDRYQKIPLVRLLLGHTVDRLLGYINQLPSTHPLARVRRAASNSAAIRRIWMCTVRRGQGCPTQPLTRRMSAAALEQLFKDLLNSAHRQAQGDAYEAVPGRVALVNSGLAAGGAERQIVNTLLGLQASGRCEHVALLAEYLRHTPKLDFFLHELEASGVEVAQIRPSVAKIEGGISSVSPDVAARLAEVDAPSVSEMLNMVEEFRARRPEVVHAWQDSTSIKAGIAAIIAGVPRIVLASRNLIPENFPYHQPYMRPAYRALADFPQVKFLNNSEAGAEDYTKWLEIPRDRFTVVRNGVDLGAVARAEASSVAEYRKSLGLPDTARVIGSVFRFWPEKRPMLWLEVAAIVAQRLPDAHFLIIGEGPMRKEMEAFIAQQKLVDRIRLPGTRPEVSLPISAMALFLLTSKFEGTPNVVLEAQWLGLPVVATDSGGTGESFAPGLTGLLAKGDSAEELAALVMQVFADEDLIHSARVEGPQRVRSMFGMDRMITETMALYGYAHTR